MNLIKMNKLFLTLSMLLMINVLYAGDFENLNLGLKITYPENWKSVPVLEKSKPSTVFEAIRNNNEGEFMNVVVYPTLDLKVDKMRLNDWSGELINAFGLNNNNIKSSSIQTFINGDWYSIKIEFDNNIVFIYNIIINGYNYSLSFLTENIDKEFENEVISICKSIKFTIPHNFKLIKDQLSEPYQSGTSKILSPKGFHYTKELNQKNTAPDAYSIYDNLLKGGNTDMVLVAENMQEQLFCLNIKTFDNSIDRLTMGFSSKVLSRQFEENGTKYEKVKIGDWDRSPDNVFLHKFRLSNNDIGSTHWIFYCDDNNKTIVLKIQTSTDLENEFETNFYNLILSSPIELKTELKKELVGTWNFLELRDKEGFKLDTIRHGNDIEIIAQPQLIFYKDGTYIKQYSPYNIERGKWKYDIENNIIIYHLYYSKPYNETSQFLIDKDHAYKDKKGDYYEVIKEKTVEVSNEKLIVLSDLDRQITFKKLISK